MKLGNEPKVRRVHQSQAVEVRTAVGKGRHNSVFYLFYLLLSLFQAGVYFWARECFLVSGGGKKRSI